MQASKIFGKRASVTEESSTTKFRWTSSARWLGAAFLSGFTLLALEVVWFRFLLLYLLGSSLSFSVMLAVVLGGISLGGLFASMWLRKDSGAHRYAMSIALLGGVGCVATYGLFPGLVERYELRDLKTVSEVLFVSLPLMFPVAFLSGVFFTLVGSALRRSCPSEATTTGFLSLAKTTGAAIGALAGGFIILPATGVEASLLLLAICYGVVAELVVDRSFVRSTVAFVLVRAYLVRVAR